jgi:hypothetical protein
LALKYLRCFFKTPTEERMLTLKKALEISRQHGFSSLITHPTANAKLAKSEGYYNCGISLAQDKTAGLKSVCPSSTPGCRNSCLGKFGRAEFTPKIPEARINRTKLLLNDTALFWELLEPELHAVDRKAEKLGVQVAFRPNILSDWPWHKKFPQLFELFPHWNIYGYSKVRGYAKDYLAGKMPSNYYLTFSYNERLSLDEVKSFLNDGLNVSVPFYDKKELRPRIPRRQWRNLPVVDGDKTDLRFLDPPKKIIGLKVKLPKSKQKARDVIKSAGKFFVGI